MWFLEAGVKLIIEKAEAAGGISAEGQAAFDLRMAETGDGSRIMPTPGKINIKGILTNTPNIFAMLFGGGSTTYPEIIGAIKAADADPNVDLIELDVDSPGGQMDGLYSAIQAIKEASTPVRAYVRGMAASAAYMLIAPSDEIIAQDPASRIGSIGVVRSYFVDPEEVEITSTAAPKKRPDVTTPEGVAMVKEELDPVHNLFAGVIADGRGKSIDTVNKTFGEGATLLAEDALDRGMIDAIGTSENQPQSGAIKTGGTSMLTLEQLKADNVALYNQVVAIGKAEGKTEGIAEGIETERTRTAAHIALAEDSGDLGIAIEAIKGTDGLTPAIQAAHVQATIKKLAITDRHDDDDSTAAAGNADLTVDDDNAATDEDKTMDALETIRGVERMDS